MVAETTNPQGTFELPAGIVEIKGDIPWLVTRSRTGPWIGICEPLKLTTQADTWSELMSDISWVMEAVFEDPLETGDLERFLSKIRELRYSFKKRQKRTELYRKSGTTDYIHLPKGD